MINLNEIAIGDVVCIPAREMTPIYVMPYSKEHRVRGPETVITFKCKKDYDFNLVYNDSIRLNDFYYYGLTLVEENVKGDLKEVIFKADTMNLINQKTITIKNKDVL